MGSTGMERVNPELETRGPLGSSGMLPCSVWFLDVSGRLPVVWLQLLCFLDLSAAHGQPRPNKMHLLSNAASRKRKKLIEKVI